MLSLFLKKNKIWFESKFGARTFSQRKGHFQTEQNISTTKTTFLCLFTLFYISQWHKCHSDIPRTPSPMLSHWLHCQDYRDNVYIFMYTFYLYVLCVSRPDTPNTVPFSVYAPLTRFTCAFDLPYTYTYYLYV